MTKKFRDMTAVRNVSYTMTAGVYGLLGINGAGKTTLMRMLCTLLKPTGGSITWDGEDIFEMDGEYRKILGYLPQDFGYYPDFTVYDYLMYIASIKGVRPAAARQQIKLLLDQVGMKKAAKRKMK
ncbi:ATP-binding cassette domain-containing protein, partial [Bacteroides caecimuris]|uniref:ATP-binding cassette domain-containing protein n=1 Tax=Bacteroides caecimuris TaxID=1796613 RepID=UPI0025709B79